MINLIQAESPQLLFAINMRFIGRIDAEDACSIMINMMNFRNITILCCNIYAAITKCNDP